MEGDDPVLIKFLADHDAAPTPRRSKFSKKKGHELTLFLPTVKGIKNKLKQKQSKLISCERAGGIIRPSTVGDGAEMGAKQAEEGRVTSHSDTAGEGGEGQDLKENKAGK